MIKQPESQQPLLREPSSSQLTAGISKQEKEALLTAATISQLAPYFTPSNFPKDQKKVRGDIFSVFADDNHPYRPKYDEDYFAEEEENTEEVKQQHFAQLVEEEEVSYVIRVNQFFTKIQNFLFVTLEQPKRKGNRVGRVINFFIMILILISIANFIIATEPRLETAEVFHNISYIVEQICVGIFCIEFLLRFYAITAQESTYYYRMGPIVGRLRYLISFNAIIDFVSIVPTIITSIIYMILPDSTDVLLLRELVALRILRVLKLLKADKYLNASALIVNCIVKKRRELAISLFLYLVTVLIIGAAIYYAERDVNSVEFGSISLGMYWACVGLFVFFWLPLISLLAMSHGNIGAIPVTPAGMIINVISGIVAYTFVALPTSIIGYAFVEELQVRMNEVEEAKRKEAEMRAKAMIQELEEIKKEKQRDEEEESSKSSSNHKKPTCHITCPNCAHVFKKRYKVSFVEDDENYNNNE